MPPTYIASIFLVISLISAEAKCQHLFGNPSCSDWQKLSESEKNIWLSAYLVPLKLTNVSRNKPKVDKFSQLTSIDPAVQYVDSFCISHSDEVAAVGAIRFLDELTFDSKSN